MDYRVERLRSRLKCKNIVVYGTGINAKRVIEGLEGYYIVGVLDISRENGEYEAHRIISVDELIRLHPEAVIVAAQLSVTLSIYHRMREVCRDNDIALLDMWGNDLFNLMDDLERQKESTFSRNFRELQKEIDRHEVISFDVFDTLIMRNTLYPMDVFDIIEERAKKKGIVVPEFGKNRALAEQSLDCISPNIYQIYDAYQQRQRISVLQKRCLLDMELSAEQKVLVRREDVVKAMDYAVQMGKKVYLISDMYLPKEVLALYLRNLGIEGYKDILVSCDYHQTKYTRLYKIFMDKYPAQSYLHIGDNIEADGFCAKSHGIDVYIIDSAYSLLKKSSYQKMLHCAHTLNERSMLGLLTAEVFNSPFTLYNLDGRPYIDKVWDVSYTFLSPIIMKLLLWLMEELGRGNYDKVLFSARDGFLMQKLYQFVRNELQLTDLPEDIYFQASRVLCALAGMQNESDIKWMLSAPFEMSWKEVLEERFNLAAEEILEVNLQDYVSIEGYAMAHKEKIYEHSRAVRENYALYMEKQGLQAGKRYAFFDFVSCGTCQYFLSRNVPFSLEGLYCGYYDSITGGKRDVPIKALFVNKNYFEKETVFFKNYLMYETVMTSGDSSVVNMDDSGFPVFAKETRNRHQLEVVDVMQAAVMEYVKRYITTLYVQDSTIETEYVDKIFGLLALEYTNENCSDLNCIELMDDFGKNVLKITRNQIQ